MPKITGGLADISTERRVAIPGLYSVKIENVEYTKSRNDIPMFKITSVILDEEDAQGNSVKGILMTDVFTTQTKTGERNVAGLAAFKRVVEQTLGEEKANDPEFDSDELIGWQGIGQVIVRDYESNEVDLNTGAKIMAQANQVQRYGNG